jgi:ABC-2 type transport system permease protein
VNWNLIRKTIRDRGRGTSIYAGANALYVLLICAVFPTVKGIKQEAMQNYPKSLSRFFGVQSLDLKSFNNYIVVQFLALIWVVIVAAFVISFARNMIAGELEEGTLELLLSQPIERWQVLTSEGATLLAGIVGIVVTTILSIIIFGSAFKVGLTFGGYFAFAVLATALFIAIAGYSFFFSAVFNEHRRAVMAAAGLTLAFYLLHFAATYSGVMDKIDWFGIFHYYNAFAVVNGGGFPVKDVLVLLLFGAIGFGAALWVFRAKDIT